LKTSLLNGLNTEDKKEIKGLFIEALRLRKRLVEVLNQKATATQTERLEKIKYDSPSWAFLQADLNGYERGIREAISPLEEIEK
jgi:hypothetical protein